MEKELVERAAVFAAKAHGGVCRKGSDIPYILHPMETAAVAGGLTDDREIIAAALLHDVIEDAGVTRAQLETEFGPRVAALVAAESENKREELPAAETWRIRKEETIAEMKTAPLEIKIIAFSDKLANLRSVRRDYRRLGAALWARFNQHDPAAHGWYYGSLFAEFGCFRGTPEYDEYREILDEVFGK